MTNGWLSGWSKVSCEHPTMKDGEVTKEKGRMGYHGIWDIIGKWWFNGILLDFMGFYGIFLGFHGWSSNRWYLGKLQRPHCPSLGMVNSGDDYPLLWPNNAGQWIIVILPGYHISHSVDPSMGYDHGYQPHTLSESKWDGLHLEGDDFTWWIHLPGDHLRVSMGSNPMVPMWRPFKVLPTEL